MTVPTSLYDKNDSVMTRSKFQPLIKRKPSIVVKTGTTPNSSPLPRRPIHESLPHLYLPDVEPHPDLYHDADAMTVATQITIDSDETRTTAINEKEALDTTNENNLNTSKTVVDFHRCYHNQKHHLRRHLFFLNPMPHRRI
ncbi:unnamed protein product [Didymodactylos carnosus]|uniref:Uncharacterized protein n=1 Tax=Didymodactylos carnosus TaxID=1234261 RepID=A0A813VSW7_9BILA|nr:unnamed protein product [Didymodactylos carnosus]CAF0902300.1 unnamed protein product [Didymodactylos carnosus]CAF3638036.1 unnamed protein product [Didymodactylos carnosus]CAF3682778.1 unnamed protein product [Didymodactylos carnosus]